VVGITAAWATSNKGGPKPNEQLINITLTVRNDSGATITNIQPLPLDVSGGRELLSYPRAEQSILATERRGCPLYLQLTSDVDLTVKRLGYGYRPRR
jgi:hypothetical protein